MSIEPPSNAEESGAPAFVEELVKKAETACASDVHLQMKNGLAEVSFRLDGVITPVLSIPIGLADRVVGRIKYLSRLKTYQELLPQDGRINKADVGASSDLRVSTYPTVTGEKIVLRLFGEGELRPLDGMGLDPGTLAALKRSLKQPSGLLLLTGPAGSGKTTTIYGCLDAIARQGGRHVITVEDPVEQMIPGVMQTEVAEARGLTFAVAARHLLRQDPEVLVIGEIRDEETARIVVRAAMTGHLVISTLHAGSCVGVLERLTTLCPDRSAVGAGLELILNQRLLRKLCTQCRGSGCEACLQTGYRGRVPVVERLQVTGEIRSLIQRGEWSGLAPENRLGECARRLVTEGITSAAEYERILGNEIG